MYVQIRNTTVMLFLGILKLNDSQVLGHVFVLEVQLSMGDAITRTGH